MVVARRGPPPELPPWPPARKPRSRWPLRALIALVIATLVVIAFLAAGDAGSHMVNVPATPGYTPSVFYPSP
jgi:hypothetical protein